MKYSLFFILVIPIILLGSCSKTPANPPINPPTFSLLVKTITDLTENIFDTTNSFHNTYHFYYDSLNRISEIKSDNSDINFEYSDHVIRKNVYADDSSAVHYSYYYNSDSLLDSTVSIFDSTDSFFYTRSIHMVYNYNSLNQAVQGTETSVYKSGDTVTIVFKYKYDTKGNVTSITRNFENSAISGETFIYSDSANFITSADMMDPDKIHSPNLISKASYDDYYLPGSYESFYEYEFDEYKRIKVVTERIGHLGTQTDTHTLTYDYY